MSLKNKILILIGFCTLISVSSFFIIKMMFDNFEQQLVEKCRIESITGAKITSELIELMIDFNLLSESDVFDTNYIPIKGSKPTKFHTKYDKTFDKYIQKIEDEFLRDPDVIFAILIDKNGYVPTHNSKFSQPLTDDHKHNLMYSRSKRNYSDTEEIKKALQSSEKEYIQIMYTRDTGEQTWIIGSPVKIKNKHWGQFIIGISLVRINQLKNQMIILISAVMFVILGMTILALIAIMPRKIFHDDLDVKKY